MAKTKRATKSKQEEISKNLKTRILAGACLFFVGITALKQGFVGIQINSIVCILFGHIAGVVYLLVGILCCYILFYAKMPQFKGPRAIGSYLLCIAVLLLASIPKHASIVGVSVISQYIKSGVSNQGGLIGNIFYGLFSSLFAYWGSLFAGLFIGLLGLVLVGGKHYFQYLDKRKKTKDKAKSTIRVDNKPYTVKKEKKTTIRDFFTQPDAKNGPLFEESVFDTTEKKETIDFQPIKIHQAHPSSTLKLNQETMKMEVSEDKELPKKEETDEIVLSTSEPIDETKYRLPPIKLLKASPVSKGNDNRSVALEKAEELSTVLSQFGVKATVQDIFIGPTVTKYELKLETGTRVNKILQLQDDIKLALATKDIRIEAPIPGKAAVGIEIPNESSSAVSFKEVFKDIPKELQDNKLLVPLGKDVSGHCIFGELDKMPHLLIAGATGSGKSVCINTIICSILMRAKPNEVRLILVDPKKVELSNYNGVPHLLAPVVTDPKKAANVLREVVNEMERRYELFASSNVRNISTYNTYVKTKNENLEEGQEKLEKLSYHVVILDEVADLMMVASKDVEDCIMRISQMARAAGIHLIVATQRPSTDVITGVIKANIPSRIAFAVSSSIDSRTILDCTGAEKLLGKGDMLFSPMGSTSPTRVQGAFVSDSEVEAITHFVASQQQTAYVDNFVNVTQTSTQSATKDDQMDEEYEECRDFVIQVQKASASLLQRQFRIGYNKAARIIDQLEIDGIIGPQIGSKPREVYVRGYSEE